MTDPKDIRFKAYAQFREAGDINFSDAEMEKYMSSGDNRESFHKYLSDIYGDAGSFSEWEAKYFPEYSKKKDSGDLGAESTESSSGPEHQYSYSELQDVGILPKDIEQPAPKPVVEEPLSYVDTIQQPKPESTAMVNMGLLAQYNDAILKRQQSYIDAIKNVPDEDLADPSKAFDLLVTDDASRKLHNDPNSSDYTKGAIKASTIKDASGLIADRMALIEQGLSEQVLDRYSDAKAALIQIQQSGDPTMVVEGRDAQQWMDDYDILRQSEPSLQEYDQLNEKLYVLGQSYNSIASINPTFFKDIEKRKQKQIMADVLFSTTTLPGQELARNIGLSAVEEMVNMTKGFVGFVGAVGNSFGNSAERYDWADRWAETAARKMDPGAVLMLPSSARRNVFTTAARVGDYQIDIDSQGNPLAVRDQAGYLVFNEETKNQIIDQYEAAPDKYDIRYRPHLAPAISTVTQGAVQVLVTSRIAGLGRTAAAAKGIVAGTLTARYAGQNYLQALEEWGPQHATTAARFAIGTAAMQSMISIYVNPLEIKLNPQFALSAKTIKRVAKALDGGTLPSAALRTGFRAYAGDMARGIATYGKNILGEGVEGVLEQVVDVGGRKIVRSSTDIRAEYDVSLGAFTDAFVSEAVGAMGASSFVAHSNWQHEALMIAYENSDRILPMVEKMYGADAVERLKTTFADADKLIRGKRLSREQENKILVDTYQKVINVDEKAATPPPPVETEPIVPITEQPVQEGEAQVASASVYDIVREEAAILMLEPGTSFVAEGGTPFTVVREGDREGSIVLVNEDTGREIISDKNGLRDAIRKQYDDHLAVAYPGINVDRLNGIRRGMGEMASQKVLPAPTTNEVQVPTPVEAPATMENTTGKEVPTGVGTYTVETIRDAEGIDGNALADVFNVASDVVPDMTIQVFDNSEQLHEAMGEQGNAFVSADGKTIFISKESSITDAIHETIHPIVVAAELRNPGTIESFYKELLGQMPQDVVSELEAFIAQPGYENYTPEARQEEAVVEFLTNMVDGKYDESVFKQEGYLDKLIKWFRDLFAKMGLADPPNDLASIKDFSAKLVDAFKGGKAISFEGEVKTDTAVEGEAKARKGYLRLIFQNEEVFIPHNELPQMDGTPITSDPRPWLENNRPDLLNEYDAGLASKQEWSNRFDAKVEEMRAKARFVENNLDPNYYRAKKWMREEMAHTLDKTQLVDDAENIFGISRAQAEIMYDVLYHSPDIKKYSPPAGISIEKKGLSGTMARLGQFKNEWLLKSKGMPIEVLQGLEAALGTTERRVRYMADAYIRVTKMIDKLPKDRRDTVRDMANRFINGRLGDAEIKDLPGNIYAELLQMRTWIDEVSTGILNDAPNSALRTEIIASNFGEYVSRVFKVHLTSQYEPTLAAIKKFHEEYRRRNFDRISNDPANINKTQEQLEATIAHQAELEWKRTVAQYQNEYGGVGQNKSAKPTGIMKQRKSLPGRAADLWEAIDAGKFGPMTLPPQPGPVANTGNPEFEALFNRAWEDLRQNRLREAYYIHPEYTNRYSKLEKIGEKLLRLGTGIGVIAPGSNPFTKENIRNAVENRTPFQYNTLPPNTDPDRARQFNEALNQLNDGIVDISNAVLEQVQMDMDSIMANKNWIDGSNGFSDIEHLTPGYRAILGEMPPLEASIITMSKLAHYYNLNKYYRYIRSVGENVFLFSEGDKTAPTWATAKIPGKETDADKVPADAQSERLAPISGFYTSPDIAAMITNVETFSTSAHDAFLRGYMKFNGIVQYCKTIASPATQAKNILSNLTFVMRNMWANPLMVGMAFAYVPADALLRHITNGKRLSTSDTNQLAQLKQMSDAFSAAFFDNFGNPAWKQQWDIGSSVPFKMDMAKYGFTADQSVTFAAAKRTILEGIKKQQSRRMIVFDAVNNHGITEDQARGMYADLQQKSFRDEMSELVNKLGSEGLLGTSVSLRTIMGNIDQMSNGQKATVLAMNSILYEPADPITRMIKKGVQTFIKNPLKRAEQLYSFGDDMFKIFGYLRERQSYSKILFDKSYHLLSEDQQLEVDNKSIEIVKNIIPNYDRIGRLGKVISKNIFVGNFIAFKIEAMRTWYNQFALSMKEMRDGKKSGNDKMLRQGAARMAGNAVMFGMNKALEAGMIMGAYKYVPKAFMFIGDAMSGLFDDDNDDELKRMLRDYMLPWAENDYLVVTDVNTEDGTVTVQSISANHPFGDFQRASIALEMGISNADPAVQTGITMAMELLGQLGQTKIFTDAVSHVMTGTDQYGRDIFNKPTKDYPGDSPEVIATKVTTYLIKTAGPGVIGQLSRLGALDFLPENEWFGSFRKPTHAGDLGEELLGMATGFRPIVINFYDSFERRIRAYMTAWGSEGAEKKVAGMPQFWNENIDNETFEQQIKNMVQVEYISLESLHQAYAMPLKFGVTQADRMAEILDAMKLSENENTATGRKRAMIQRGKYTLPIDQINKIADKRKEKYKEGYQMSDELKQWLVDFELDKQ